MEDQVRQVLGEYVDNLRQLEKHRDEIIKAVRSALANSGGVLTDWIASGPRNPEDIKALRELQKSATDKMIEMSGILKDRAQEGRERLERIFDLSQEMVVTGQVNPVEVLKLLRDSSAESTRQLPTVESVAETMNREQSVLNDFVASGRGGLEGR